MVTRAVCVRALAGGACPSVGIAITTRSPLELEPAPLPCEAANAKKKIRRKSLLLGLHEGSGMGRVTRRPPWPGDPLCMLTGRAGWETQKPSPRERAGSGGWRVLAVWQQEHTGKPGSLCPLCPQRKPSPPGGTAAYLIQLDSENHTQAPGAMGPPAYLGPRGPS